MKRILLIPVFAIVVGGIFAADMVGDYNTWLGYIAGINAEGDRTTLQGAGAGGESRQLIRTDIIGAAAGAYSTNLVDCVGIGYHSLRNSSDMSNVVAIGRGVFKDHHGVSNATDINGHFRVIAGNLYISDGRKTRISNELDVLSINADSRIILNAPYVEFRNGDTIMPSISEQLDSLNARLNDALERIAALEARINN